ncbi:MAG: hypothetical protein OEW19_15980 [Acidobacteriota bacterium]|nr:hypothetical protein [Acidobacteriota bacterium]
MLLQQAPDTLPDIVAPTVTIVEVVNQRTPELSMIDVAVAAFGLTGVIMAAATVAGLLAGVLFIWYRSRRAITVIEARGGQHDLFKV